jgi:two-component system cell cycle response regulator DivK
MSESASARRPGVLLIEPHEDTREMYTEFLSQSGYHTIATNTTDAGLTLARDVDLVVTALSVPGSFDGLELVRRLRANEPKKPIIVVTTHADTKTQHAAFQAGCTAYLTKPCLPHTLRERVARASSETQALGRHSHDRLGSHRSH